MAIQKIHNKLRYFISPSIPNSIVSQTPQLYISLACLPKTIVSPIPTSAIFFNFYYFHSKTASIPLSSLTASTGFSSSLMNLRWFKPYCHGGFLSLSTSSSDVPTSSTPLAENSRIRNHGGNGIMRNASPKEVSDLIDMIRKGENDLESKLDSINVSLSVSSISQIFGVLNGEKVSALRFFDWIRSSRPNLRGNYDICSLVIDNCGRLNDFEAMLCVLNDFRQRGICLTQKAFGFLSVLILEKPLIMDSVRKVVTVLNEVGGSCAVSGIRSLIEMFSVLGSFEMAKYVIQITEKKVSYYYIIIKEKCRRSDFIGARAILDEMRQVDCVPTVNIYNYILSNLCKNNESSEASELLKEMQEENCPPDDLTFEILVCQSCKLCNFDYAIKLLDGMVSRGLEPRLTTHATMVKAYFDSKRYEEAYNYVVDSSVKHKCSSNTIYSLLVRLHQKKGNVGTAQIILSEMTKKGLRPNFAVYRRRLKKFSDARQENSARNLENGFSSLSLQSAIKQDFGK